MCKINIIAIKGENWYNATDIRMFINNNTESKYRDNNTIIRSLEKEYIKKIKCKTTFGYQPIIHISKKGIHMLLTTLRYLTNNDRNRLYKQITNEDFQEYITVKHKEVEFINNLETQLKILNIPSGKRQFKVLSYRIDYYIPSLNIAIEYDENRHSSYSYESEELRQANIEQKLKCEFIRVSEKNDDFYNCAFVIKKLLEVLLRKK